MSVLRSKRAVPTSCFKLRLLHLQGECWHGGVERGVLQQLLWHGACARTSTAHAFTLKHVSLSDSHLTVLCASGGIRGKYHNGGVRYTVPHGDLQRGSVWSHLQSLQTRTRRPFPWA